MDSMTPRERVLTAFDRRLPDRVPRAAPGLVPAQLEVFRQKTGTSDVNAYFQCDVRKLGFAAPETLPDFSAYYRDVGVPYHLSVGGEYGAEWGIRSIKAVFYHFSAPLFSMRNFTSARELADYPFPDFVRDWRHDHFEDAVREYHDAGLPVFGIVGHIFQTTWLMRSRERLFVDFVDNPEFADALLSRVSAIRTAMAVRYAEAGVDGIQLADDIAMQDRLMMSPAMWRKWLKPRLAGLISAARRVKPDLHVCYHSDGNTEEVIADLAEVGVTVLWTVQPECMDPVHIKMTFGDRLAFAGTIGVQSTLPFGTPDEVRRVVKEHIETVGKGGGFLLCPANSIEPEVPWENIVAMYEAADQFGVYGDSGSSPSSLSRQD